MSEKDLPSLCVKNDMEKFESVVKWYYEDSKIFFSKEECIMWCLRTLVYNFITNKQKCIYIFNPKFGIS